MNKWPSKDQTAAALAGAIALGGLAAACNKSPASPSFTPPVAPSRPRLEIVGLGTPLHYPGDPPTYTVAPGETAQFRAIATLTNGTSRDVTSESLWVSTNYNYMSVIGPG